MSNLVILLAHGSRDPAWSNTFELFTKKTRSKHTNTTLAYMELSEPSLANAVKNAVIEGYESISVLPLFLAKGKHLRHDIPKQLLEFEKLYGKPIKLLAPLGEHSELAVAVEAIVDRYLK